MCTTRWSNSRACQRLMKGDNCTSAYRATLSFQLSFLGSPSKLNPKWVHAMDSSMVTTRNLQLVHRDNASELSVVKARMRRIVEMCQSLLWSFEFCQKIKMFFFVLTRQQRPLDDSRRWRREKIIFSLFPQSSAALDNVIVKDWMPICKTVTTESDISCLSFVAGPCPCLLPWLCFSLFCLQKAKSQHVVCFRCTACLLHPQVLLKF